MNFTYLYRATNPFSEKSDVGGVSNSNVTDAGRFDSRDESPRVLHIFTSMNPVSEKSDVGGVSNSNVTDAGRFDSWDESP